MTKRIQPFAIHWFRRDLRLADHSALQAMAKRYEGRVLGIFCFDSKFLEREDFSPNRFAFFLASLRSLREEMQKNGGDLLIVDEAPKDFFTRLSQKLVEASARAEWKEVSFSRDYEPFARKRDANMISLLQRLGVGVHTERDHLVIEPHELTKDSPGSFYQVFTPFSRRWFELFSEEGFQARARASNGPPMQLKLTWNTIWGEKNPFPDALENFEKKNLPRVTIPIPAAGSANAWHRLQKFRGSLHEYDSARDIPAKDGTSQLSIFFKNGSLTTSQAIAALSIKTRSVKHSDSETRFLKEIVWREFYYHILYHRPDVEGQSFLEKYRSIAWENRKDWFKAWREGLTGFPIVDAGMRQLKTTGWMHNRVRMIVASFLTKDLLIDWRLGENYFMKTLLDGDLAPNNGGWQWAASTGCDPQPYFRVFNPWLQGAKFDPEGTYIKTYLPELRDIPGAKLHHPEGVGKFAKYPQPIVDHATQKAKAIALYK